jgi:hypothetical protein
MAVSHLSVLSASKPSLLSISTALAVTVVPRRQRQSIDTLRYYTYPDQHLYIWPVAVRFEGATSEADIVYTLSGVSRETQRQVHAQHRTTMRQDSSCPKLGRSQGWTLREPPPICFTNPDGSHQPRFAHPFPHQVETVAQTKQALLMFFQIHRFGQAVDGSSYPGLQDACATLQKRNKAVKSPRWTHRTRSFAATVCKSAVQRARPDAAVSLVEVAWVLMKDRRVNRSAQQVARYVIRHRSAVSL